MKNKKNSSLYLLCSPNIGLLDNWLPVVHKLKKYNPNLDCHLIFTTVEATMSINFDNAVISISSDIFDSTIFRTSTGLFVRTKSLESAKSICSVGSLLSRVLRYNSAGKKNIFLKKLTYIFFVIYRFIEFFRYKNNIVKFNSIIAGNDILLYDVHVQNFNFERSVIALFIYKFSMPHGIDISKNQNKKMVKNKDFDLVSSTKSFMCCK